MSHWVSAHSRASTMAISAKTASRVSTITPKVLSGPKNDAALKPVLLRYLYPRNATKTRCV